MTEIRWELYRRALGIMFSQVSVTEGMNKLDTVCREGAPHSIWDKLRRLKYGTELSLLLEWTRKRLEAHRVGVAVLYFGISDMGDSLTFALLRERRQPRPQSNWSADAAEPYYEVPLRLLKTMFRLAEKELA